MFLNFSINIGRKQGVSPIELISIINRALKSNEIEIGGIDIRESYTIFEIDSKIKSELINKIKKIDYNDINLKIIETNEDIGKKFLKRKKNKTFSFKKKRKKRADKNYIFKDNVKFKRKKKKKKNRY
ncbi:MAG: DbpA RNA binding domain-containing protein [Flavobacteriaceae bacterium]